MIRFVSAVLVALPIALFACKSQDTQLPSGGGNGNGQGGGTSSADGGGSTYDFEHGGANGGQMTGQQAVQGRGCPVCHGNDMSGSTSPLKPIANQPATDSLYPPNLTPDKTTGVGDWSDEQLKAAIVEGVDNEGLRLCPEMKHYTTMQDDEVAAIIGYLRSLPAVKKAVPSSVCPPLKGG